MSRNSSQKFKPATRATIDGNLRAKARLNKDVIPVAIGNVVTYRANDGTRPFYVVTDANMDSDGIYEVEIQKIGADGILMSQRFPTTMDKLDRFWLQYKDMVEVDKPKSPPFLGEVTSIYIDHTGDLTVVVTGAGKKSMMCDKDDLKYLTFYPSEAF